MLILRNVKLKTHFTSSDLKLIAMGTMAVDHAAVFMIYVNGYGELPVWSEIGLAMRLIGRVAFPLYAFMLVQGFLYTKSRGAYLARLAVLAAFSELPFNLVASGQIFYPEGQNTVVLLCIGLAALWGIETVSAWQRPQETETVSGWQRPQGTETVSGWQRPQETESGRVFALAGNEPGKNSHGPGRTAAMGFIAAAAMLLALLVRADYGAYGILFILVLYWFRNSPAERSLAGAVTLIFSEGPVYGLAAWIAFFFINRYNGEKGRKLGRLPYLFYPGHLLIIYAAGVFFL